MKKWNERRARVIVIGMFVAAVPLLAGTALAAKGGSGGGGGGKPGGGEPAVPTLAYSSAGVHVVAADGTNDQNLGNRNASRVNWSPDGSKLAFWDIGGIHTINADGSGRALVIPGFATYIGGHGVEWSPDGAHIVFDDLNAPGEGEVDGRDLETARAEAVGVLEDHAAVVHLDDGADGAAPEPHLGVGVNLSHELPRALPSERPPPRRGPRPGSPGDRRA